MLPNALLDAIAIAPSARGWLPGMIGYEALLLRELGYGGDALRAAGFAITPIDKYNQLAERR